MIAVFFFKQPLSHHRIIGFALVITGIVIFLFTGLSMHEKHTSDSLIGSETLGQLLFLFASLMWAIFTISARVANLNALVVAGLVSLMSSILLIALIVAGVLPSYLYQQSMPQWPVNELLTHSAIQGWELGLLRQLLTYMRYRHLALNALPLLVVQRLLSPLYWLYQSSTKYQV